VYSDTSVTLEVVEEICDDGEDNDGNGQTDCDDSKCAAATACLPLVTATATVTEGTPTATATPTGEMTPPTATPTRQVTPPTATPTGDVTPPTATPTIPACAALVSSGKSTSQSSTRGVHPASFAVDGTKDGAFASCSQTDLVAGTNSWWEVDLGANYVIYRIDLYNRTDAGAAVADRLKNYYVLASTAANPVVGSGGIYQNFQSITADSPTGIFPAGVLGRYVRIEEDRPEFLHMSEVEVFGCVPTATPTATVTNTPHQPPTATPTGDFTPPPSNTANPSASPTPTATPFAGCVGDCNGNGVVTIDELIRAVGISLGLADLDTASPPTAIRTARSRSTSSSPP
jgi:hypothetical protein